MRLRDKYGVVHDMATSAYIRCELNPRGIFVVSWARDLNSMEPTQDATTCLECVVLLRGNHG